MRWTPLLVAVVAACSGPDQDTGEDCSTIVFTDADGDRFGDPATETKVCAVATGQVLAGGDCDDADDQVNPDAEEVCDGKDDNCDGQIDEGLPTTIYHPDADGDGFGATFANVEACAQPADALADNSDCDDTNPDVNPTGREVCDALDDDCDGRVDDDDDRLDLTTTQDWYLDLDGDGFGLDASLVKACVDPMPGSTVQQGGDCNDGSPYVNPDAQEICNPADEDCDGLTNEADPSLDLTTETTFCHDGDRDGFGDPSTALDACAPPARYVPDCTDPNDADPGVP